MRIAAPRIADLSIPNGWQWEHFRPAELADRRDGSIVIVTEFLDRLEELRRRFKRPMIITSGYRTPAHNKQVSTTGEHGPHTTGRAVDVNVTSARERFQLVALALDCGFTGVGLGETFVHLDDIADDPRIPRPAMWTY